MTTSWILVHLWSPQNFWIMKPVLLALGAQALVSLGSILFPRILENHKECMERDKHMTYIVAYMRPVTKLTKVSFL